MSVEIGLISEAGYKTGWRKVVPDYERIELKTPAGTVRALAGRIRGRSVIVVPRWGLEERMPPPHRLPFKALALGFQQAGVTRIVSENGSGCLAPGIEPLDIVVPDDFIDLTDERPLTMFDDPEDPNYGARIDMTEAFCPEIRATLISAATARSKVVYPRGVFGNREGPRMGTPAESRMMRVLGADVVGAPVTTEAIMSRELGLCYAVIAPIQNYAPGIRQPGVGAGAHIPWLAPDDMTKLHAVTNEIIHDTIASIPQTRGCNCQNALAGFRERVEEFRVFRD